VSTYSYVEILFLIHGMLLFGDGVLTEVDRGRGVMWVGPNLIFLVYLKEKRLGNS
jgi:hypothetical protein